VGFCDLPLADKLCSVGDAVDFASNPGKAIGDWMAKSAGELAAAAADLAAEAVDSTTKVDLNAGWFVDNYEMLLPLGLVLIVATFCAQLVRAAVRRDGQALTQAFTGTASGVLFAFCAIAFTTVAVEVVDAISDGLFKTANLSIESAVRRVVRVNQIAALTSLGWLIPVVVGLGAATGAFLYWCVMMVRKVGILVMVTLAIFASAGGGWEVARRWRKGWVEATATLVVSKLLMTVIFVLGIAAMGKTEADDGIAALADVMSGIVIMVLVLLCPYAVFKFVHWAVALARRSRRRTQKRPDARPPRWRPPPEPVVPRPEQVLPRRAPTAALAVSPATSPPTRAVEAEARRKVHNPAERASRPVAMPSSPVWRRRSSPRRPACPPTPVARWAAAKGPADPARTPHPARAADGSPPHRARHRRPRAHRRPPAHRTPRPKGRLRRRPRPASDPLPRSRGRDVHACSRPRVPLAPPGPAP